MKVQSARWFFRFTVHVVSLSAYAFDLYIDYLNQLYFI
jgi:hypothetical protein